MRAIDIFGLAGATLIALITLIIEPWSPQWWAGVIAASVIALAALGHIIFRGIRNSWRSKPLHKVIEPKINIPSLLSLFMTDFAGKGSGAGACAQLSCYVDFTINEVETCRIFYNLIHDYGSRSKFIAFYVPRSKYTFEICKSLAEVYNQYLDIPIEIESGNAFHPVPTKAGELVFTGRIFIYYEVALSLAQLGEIGTIFESQNINAEFRGDSYALAVYTSIRAGNVKPPKHYEIKDGAIVPASDYAIAKSNSAIPAATR